MTELFGVKHPIMLAGMNWVSDPKLVAAVSNAGGLGMLGIGRFRPEEALRHIRETKALTDKPFGINQTLIHPTAKENIAAAIDEKVPVINYGLGRPWFIDQVHQYGGKVIGTVATVKHAIRAEQLGVDILSVTGHEGAGHVGRITTLVLIPLVVNSVKIPLIAAGGFVDGKGLAAALVMGADAISMGTRFVVTKECIIHEHLKELILKATAQDTLYIDRRELPIRALKTKRAESEMRGGVPIIHAISSIFDTKRMLKLSWLQLFSYCEKARRIEGGMGMLGQVRYATDAARWGRVVFNGNEDAGLFSAGQSVGGTKDMPSCQELIERIVAEAKKSLELACQRL